MPGRVLALLFFSLLFGGTALFAQTPTVPALTGPVVDQANLLPPSAEKRISDFLMRLKEHSGHEVAVLTIPSLGDLTIEEYSIRVADQWKLGSQADDDGVLLLIAQKERTVRIEVGQGLEGDLTDAHSKRIIEQDILPQFRAERFEDGIAMGVQRIAEYIYPEGTLPRAVRTPSHRVDLNAVILIVILLLLLALIRVLERWGGGSGMGPWTPRHRGGFGRGGFGGGFGSGWGGGRFGGGGGGFSGGGATGRW